MVYKNHAQATDFSFVHRLSQIYTDYKYQRYFDYHRLTSSTRFGLRNCHIRCFILFPFTNRRLTHYYLIMQSQSKRVFIALSKRHATKLARERPGISRCWKIIQRNLDLRRNRHIRRYYCLISSTTLGFLSKSDDRCCS